MAEITEDEKLAEYRKGFKEGYKAGYRDANKIVQSDPESKWRHP
jgi:flagellar biosynthesis/type III secretory pathway protein FliH